MSQENVEILLGGYEWFRAKGKFPAHLATPDFVWDMSHFEGWPEQQVYEGRLDLPRRQGGAMDMYSDPRHALEAVGLEE